MSGPRDVCSSREAAPSLLVVAAFSRFPEALAWAEEKLALLHGPIALRSPDYSFHHTCYYEKTMGPDLVKRLIVFRDFYPPDKLADAKLQAIRLEEDVRIGSRFPEARPLNLDPGLLQLGKFLLATTKDQAHRIYLRDGIFAEVTLRFHNDEFDAWPWTYADYREPAVREFLRSARHYLYNCFRTSRTPAAEQG